MPNILTQVDKVHSLFQRTPLLDGGDAELKREEIRSYFHTTFDRYELLFETLAQADCLASSADFLSGSYRNLFYQQTGYCRPLQRAYQPPLRIHVLCGG